MTVSRKLNKPYHPPLTMNNTIIENVREHKHLGLILSDDGSWHKHIDMIVKKAFNRLNILRKFRYYLDRKTLEKLYISFIRPILEYGDIIWDNSTALLVHKLENVQLEAARIVTGGTRLTSFTNLYKETGWEKLNSRRESHKAIFFHKMVNNVTPLYLSNLIPAQLRDVHSYNTRNSDVIPPIICRTSLYSNYFMPSTVRIWNSLPRQIQSNSSLYQIKQHFKSKSATIPAYYYFGTRNGQVFHSRLRMQCSNLNQHLFLKNLVPSPNCSCGQVESNDHFLLKCPHYNEARQRFINSLNIPMGITSSILLFGSDMLTLEENKNVFISVQKYIIHSKRFQR